MSPLFSVVIAAFNKEKRISATINSLLCQSFSDFEIIIVDDGSTDRTKTVVEHYKDPKIHYHYQYNRGVTATRNKGVEKARGKYLTFLDADDTVTETWLEQFKRAFESSDFDVVFCDVEVHSIVNNKVQLIHSRNPDRKKDNINGVFLTGAFCMKKTFFNSVGGYDENLKFGENAELSFRCSNFIYKAGFTDKTGLIYFISTDGGGQNLTNKVNDTVYILSKHQTYFAKHRTVKRFYLQSVGHSYKQLQDYRKALVYYKKAWLTQPWLIKPLLRFTLITCYLIFKSIRFKERK